MCATSARAAMVPLGAVLIAIIAHSACSSPARPSIENAVVVSRIDVISAAGPSRVAPGQSVQLTATATYSDGSQHNVTSTAVWQSSDPVTAIVSATGTVRGGRNGAVDITATLGGVAGKMRVDIGSSCAAATLSKTASSVTPFLNEIELRLTTPFSDCRWTAQSDASWVTLRGDSTFLDQGVSGDGWFWVTAAVNNTLSPRSARVVVTFTDGPTLVYSVTQSSPSCIFALSPGAATYPTSGGEGSFTVQPVPASCAWTAWIDPRTDPAWHLQVSGSGVGAGIVNYRSFPSVLVRFNIQFPVYVVGSNPLDPPAVFAFTLK